MTLKPYMGYAGDPADGACLIFAHDAKEAKKVGYGVVNSWGGEWIEMRVNLIRNEDYLFKEADPELLQADTPHVIEAPTCCNCCEKWGVGEIGPDRLCPDCHKDKELRDQAERRELSESQEASEYMSTLPLPQSHPWDALMSLPYDLR